MRLRSNSYWPVILAAPLGLLGAYLVCTGIGLPWIDQDIVAAVPALAAPFLKAGVHDTLRTLALVVETCGLIFIAASIAALLVRRYWAFWVLHKGYFLAYALFAFYVHSVIRITAVIMEANVRLDGNLPTAQSQFFLRWHFLWPAGAVLLAVALLHLLSWRRRVYVLYTGVHDDTPAMGDRIIENLLSNGHDVRFRQSMLGSLGLHVLIILVVPWLLSLLLHVTPYRIFKGSGTPTTGHAGASAVPIKVVKPKGKTAFKKKKFLVNPQAAISFHVPDLDESQAGADLDKGTALTYVADNSRNGVNGGAGQGQGDGRGSGLGRGNGRGSGFRLGAGGGRLGGWPDGSENAVVRFIRLEYNGVNWADGMNDGTDSDINFLKRFHEEFGIPVASRGESNPIRALKKYPPGFAPPFVYMNGDVGIDIPPGDMQTLRDYLINGGMLFADCGTPQWNESFHNFASRLFPDSPLLVIADDDLIFQEPFQFANGAPPMWHHGGMRALGIKYNDRWVVFYHPGDVHDAWKTGHAGASEELSEQAMEIGMNVVYYAFTRYLEATKKYRK